MVDDFNWSAQNTCAMTGVTMINPASSAAGAGTLAFFSDTEVSSRNTVQADTLDLTVGGSGSNTIINVSKVAPCATGSVRRILKKDRRFPEFLQFGIQNLESCHS
mgnify:FL=1